MIKNSLQTHQEFKRKNSRSQRKSHSGRTNRTPLHVDRDERTRLITIDSVSHRFITRIAALKSTRLSRLSRHAEHAIGVRVHVHSRPHGTRRNRCRHRIRREHDDDAHGGGGDAAKASRRGERQGDGGARVDARVRRVRKLGRDDALQSPIVVVTMGDD
jgi:hypothetical protein